MKNEHNVLCQEYDGACGLKLAVVTLNSPKTLNALNTEMIEHLYNKLQEWKNDERFACIVIQGAGEKSFCAGGDVVSLYHASAAYGETCANTDGLNFFTKEYRLDYLIHTYPKPIVVWGSGIVMGGGLGLLCGASHRIVTDSTNMSMPEVTIGLYPDVGATWFLNRAPKGVGMFLGLTGASMNAADAIFSGLADGFIPNSVKDDFFADLKGTQWSSDNTCNHKKVDAIIAAFQERNRLAIPRGNIENNLSYIRSLEQYDFLETVQKISEYDGENKWLKKASVKLRQGCPITLFLVNEQMRRGAQLTLKEVFQFELMLSVNSLRLGHFKEGVRALLIDKDNRPTWTPKTVDTVRPDDIEAFFMAPWPKDQHPLKHL
ncbi:MAG: enoyl-CoA hydratase/isomerase family protein [Agarilytica sp.]